MSAAVTAAARGHLSDAQRRQLVALIAERPHLTCGQVAKIFEARTGRRIHPSRVSVVRAAGYRSLASTSPRRHLTDGERALLERLCHQAAPSYPREAIARRFAELAGRPIHRTGVEQVPGAPLRRLREGGASMIRPTDPAAPAEDFEAIGSLPAMILGGLVARFEEASGQAERALALARLDRRLEKWAKLAVDLAVDARQALVEAILVGSFGFGAHPVRDCDRCLWPARGIRSGGRVYLIHPDPDRDDAGSYDKPPLMRLVVLDEGAIIAAAVAADLAGPAGSQSAEVPRWRSLALTSLAEELARVEGPGADVLALIEWDGDAYRAERIGALA